MKYKFMTAAATVFALAACDTTSEPNPVDLLCEENGIQYGDIEYYHDECPDEYCDKNGKYMTYREKMSGECDIWECSTNGAYYTSYSSYQGDCIRKKPCESSGGAIYYVTGAWKEVYGCTPME